MLSRSIREVLIEQALFSVHVEILLLLFLFLHEGELLEHPNPVTAGL